MMSSRLKIFRKVSIFFWKNHLEIPQKSGHFLEFYFAFLASPGVAMARQRLQISDF